MTQAPPHRALLIVLDGFGIGQASPFNPLSQTPMPFYQSLLEHFPHTSLLSHGLAVGLPEGTMGNSEVGHLTLGAGRVLLQDLTRIHQSIQSGAFFNNPALLSVFQATKRLHLVGLLSEGGVHSHLDHFFALLRLCAEKAPGCQVWIHGFLDGRDTPPHSGLSFLKKIQTNPFAQRPEICWGSLSGRYWGMDRDHRWERTQRAWAAITEAQPLSSISPLEALEKSYQAGITDEFFEPLCFDAAASFQIGDGLVFFNFRADRARQLSQLFLEKSPPTHFVSFTSYDPQRPVSAVAFPAQPLENIFAELLATHQKKQLRLAETEKYAHVTFFFNGGREKPFEGETRILVPSPKAVATYDLAPEMSAPLLAAEAKKQIETSLFDFILINFANADMVGHTGDYKASCQALKVLDQCLRIVIEAALKASYSILVTADHGNIEEMRDTQGEPHTQHTLNPVPLLCISPQGSPQALQPGTSLADVMPTLCQLMHLPIPQEVTGKGLLISQS